MGPCLFVLTSACMKPQRWTLRKRMKHPPTLLLSSFIAEAGVWQWWRWRWWQSSVDERDMGQVGVQQGRWGLLPKCAFSVWPVMHTHRLLYKKETLFFKTLFLCSLWWLMIQDLTHKHTTTPHIQLKCESLLTKVDASWGLCPHVVWFLRHYSRQDLIRQIWVCFATYYWCDLEQIN